MTKKEIALSAVEALKKEYPDAKCSLDYETPLQLLVATRLSAQCTDARVNLVTPARVFDSPIVKKPLKPHCSSQKFCQEICFMG